MHRLLQGDVGAGKTVVAVSALLVAVQGGHQGALMAPTEVLAEQHALGVRGAARRPRGARPGQPRSASGRCASSCSPTGSPGAERRRDRSPGSPTGAVDIVIGTHALIQEGVELPIASASVVIDEQHRFGVEQRAALRDKARGGAVPDVLVMTATPIPRTAAMTVYGDLDVSVLDELPPGRTPIVTQLGATGAARGGRCGPTCAPRSPPGRQAYVVCPLIEESREARGRLGRGDVRAAAAGELAGLRLGLLHGRLPPAEKETIDGRVPRAASSTCSSPRR